MHWFRYSYQYCTMCDVCDVCDVCVMCVMCVQVGQYSDQTYQQYILKALGELVLYVDGMHGLIQCNEIIQWLYELTKSKVLWRI